MSYPIVSLVANVKLTNISENLPIDQVLVQIRDGRWQDVVFPVRNARSKEEATEAKKKVPAVLMSGEFENRSDKGMKKHSGVIALDIDDLNEKTENTKEMLSMDPYVYSVFSSISGRGLCVLVKINGNKHRESFRTLQSYFFSTYDLILDPSCINESRLRFVSFDPYIYVNDNSLKWTKMPEYKEPPAATNNRILFVQNDFDAAVRDLLDRGINITEDYYTWYRIAFGLANEFGESGRHYFHSISSTSKKYTREQCDKQYNACLKADKEYSTRKTATLGTVYYYFKKEGHIEIMSERTKKIAAAAYTQMKAGTDAQTTAKNLMQFMQVPIEEGLPLIQQVRDNGIIVQEDTFEDNLENLLKSAHEFKYNEVMRKVEMDGVELSDWDMNTLWLNSRKSMGKVPYDLFVRTIMSDNGATKYNPLKEFISRNDERGKVTVSASGEFVTPNIDKFFRSINTKDSEHCIYFGRKWMVGLISNIFKKVSPLMLILCGENQNTGKTHFFRHLLPEDLRSYMADTKMDAGKDDVILMTQKILLFDDELTGFTANNLTMKGPLSKEEVTVRVPYGKSSETIPRLAGFGATSNFTNVLNDPTGGNRRFIVVEVESIDFNMINSVDRIDLFMEAVHVFQMDNNFIDFTPADILYLNKYQHLYQDTLIEGELLIRLFDPDGNSAFTAEQVMSIMKGSTMININYNILKQELKRLKFRDTTVMVNGRPTRRWLMRRRSDTEQKNDEYPSIVITPQHPDTEPDPFPKWDNEANKLVEPPAPPPAPEPEVEKFKPNISLEFNFDDFVK